MSSHTVSPQHIQAILMLVSKTGLGNKDDLPADLTTAGIKEVNQVASLEFASMVSGESGGPFLNAIKSLLDKDLDHNSQLPTMEALEDVDLDARYAQIKQQVLEYVEGVLEGIYQQVGGSLKYYEVVNNMKELDQIPTSEEEDDSEFILIYYYDDKGRQRREKLMIKGKYTLKFSELVLEPVFTQANVKPRRLVMEKGLVEGRDKNGRWAVVSSDYYREHGSVDLA